MQDNLKNQCDAILTLARQYCNDNAKHWQQEYEFNHSSHSGYSDEDYNLFPRYKTLDAIRMEVESLLDMSFASLEECRSTLVIAGQTAESLFTKGYPKHYREALAIQDEREKFVDFIQSIKDADLLHVPPLPYARRLRDTESKELHKRLREHWNCTGVDWVPLGDSCPEPYCFLALDNIAEDDISRVTDFIRSIAARRIYRFDDIRLDYEIENATFELSGNETVYADAGFDWIVYLSHEGTVTFGGQVLVDFINGLFSERKEKLNRWPDVLQCNEDRSHDGPLHFAIKNGDKKQFAELLQTKIDVNLKGQFWQTPLHRAAISGQTEFVRMLLDAGADMDVTDTCSETPLYRAVEGKHADTVSLLIERGADKNKSFPLRLAAEHGLTEILEILLASGVDANMTDWRYNTPLFYAVEHCKSEAVDLLLRYGADPNSGERNDTFPLFRAARNGDAEIARKLIQAGADINRADGSGWTSLHTAAVQGYVEVASLLLEAGAILEMRNQYGWTPLFLAAGSGQKAVVEKLLAAGANIETKDAKGLTPLENARKNGHQEVALLLQEAEGKFPKDFPADQPTETSWEELLWNYPKVTGPYTVDDWQKIIDGLVDSFNRFLGVHVVHAETPRLFIENGIPAIALDLTCTSSTPFGALNQLAKGSIDVYDSEEGKHIDARISVFLFLNETRLKAESLNAAGQDGDYIEYVFVKNPAGISTWECRGWNAGYYDEWKGTTFPARTAATHRIQVILPDKDDERYDPVTERIELCRCLFCKQGNIYPWMIRSRREMVWACEECEATWKKHMPFTEENTTGVSFHQYVESLFPGRADAFKWYEEVEPLPYQYTVENAPHYGGFSLEASSICLYGSNCFSVYECEAPLEMFEKQAVDHRFKLKAIENPIRIPRYQFRHFLQCVPSVRELDRRFPDLPFIHTATRGLYSDYEKQGRFCRIVYDEQESKFYHYRFDGRSEYKVTKDSQRLHEMLLELCKKE